MDNHNAKKQLKLPLGIGRTAPQGNDACGSCKGAGFAFHVNRNHCRTRVFPSNISYRGIRFPVHSLIVPCSDWPRNLVFPRMPGRLSQKERGTSFTPQLFRLQSPRECGTLAL